MTDKKEISMDTRVGVSLGSAGRHILREYLDPDAPKPERDRQPHRIHGEPYVYMPLWEAFKIFGPHLISSVSASTVVGAITPPASPNERRQQHLLSMMEDRLRCVINFVAGGAASSTDSLINRADEWTQLEVPEFPNTPGWWWYGDEPMLVERSGDDLVAVLKNGRRKPVDELVDQTAWAGPARRDPRVKSQDEDIPF